MTQPNNTQPNNQLAELTEFVNRELELLQSTNRERGDEIRVRLLEILEIINLINSNQSQITQLRDELQQLPAE